MAKTRRNRKHSRKGSILDVRSPSSVRGFEKLMERGPLTMVFIKASWCGACHRFNDEVWNSLTALKNRNMNLASVDSEVIGKTSLANVPRKFYPTLLLVGKDKKPATFMDEDGSPTNAMPRSNTLSEDREALTALVQNPILNTSTMSPRPVAMASPVPMASLIASPVPSLVPEAISLKKSPYVKTPNTTRNESTTAAQRPLSSMPPDVAADLVASQSKASTATAGVISESMKGGRLLKAIRSKTQSLNAMLRLRADTKAHKKTRKSTRA